MSNEVLNNVRRISYALWCATGDPAAMQRLARDLHYDLEQLRQDIADLERYTTDKVADDREED